MKFTKILKNLILEASRSSILYDKYVKPSQKAGKGLINFSDFLNLIYTDPTTRPENINLDEVSVNDIQDIHPGKYSQWILNLFTKPKLTDEVTGEELEVGTAEYKRSANEFRKHILEDLPQFKELLRKFDRFKGSLVDPTKKNIDNVKSFPELSQLQVKVGDTTVDLGQYQGKKIKKQSGTAVNKKYDVPGAEILKVGSEYTLIRISDKGTLGSKAASYFGGYSGGIDKGETNWCTAAENSVHSNTYRQQGPLYVIMANDDKGQVGQVTGLPTERYQIHFPTNQFRSRDQYSREGNVPIVEWLNGKWSEFKEIFKPEFAKGLTTGSQGKKLHIDDLQRGAVGSYVALYGLDDLFKTLPEDLEEIHIVNRDNSDIKLNIPEDIGKYQNLQGILFDNCVDSVPESLCNLKNLRFLSLTNNSRLKTIPECLSNLPKLAFLRTAGSDNLKLPQGILDKAELVGPGLYDFED